MGGEGILITAGGSTITLEQEYRRKEADLLMLIQNVI